MTQVTVMPTVDITVARCEARIHERARTRRLRMTTSDGAPIFDADTHMYETSEALTRYLPTSTRTPSSTYRSVVARASPSTVRSPTSSRTPPSTGSQHRAPTRSSSPARTPTDSHSAKCKGPPSTAHPPLAVRTNDSPRWTGRECGNHWSSPLSPASSNTRPPTIRN